MKKIRGIFVSFIKYCPLLEQLVLREIKVKYKRSFLGVLWTLLSPLLNMVVITLVFSNVFKFDIKNFPVYYLSGSIIFTFNSEATSQALYSIIGNGGLIRKVYIPKYLFPLSKVLSGLVNFTFSFIALILVMIVTGTQFHTTILMALVFLPVLFIFTLGLSMILSAVTVFFRDMIHLYSVIISLWTFLTPIFYPIESIPDTIRPIILANPMYAFVNYFRQICLYGVVPSVVEYLYCILLATVVLILGIAIFYKMQNKFILYM